MMFVRIRKASRYNFLLIISVLILCYSVGFVKAAEITWEFDGIVGLSNSGSIEGYFTHDSATQTLSNVNVKATVGGITYVITEACLLYTSPSPRDKRQSRMPSSA